MENVTTRTTPRPDSSILHELDELEERQGWAHHVADAATGELLTTELSRPVAPLSRVERLARLGHQFDPSIFGAPTYRLTPRHPYQASPAGFLDFFLAHTVSTFTDEPEGRAVWALQNIVGEFAGEMNAFLLEPPQGRCLLTLRIGTVNELGVVGRVRIQVLTWGIAQVIAAFELAVHGDNLTDHTFDLVFVSAPTVPPTRWVRMLIEPGSGLRFVQFRSLTLAPEQPSGLHP